MTTRDETVAPTVAVEMDVAALAAGLVTVAALEDTLGIAGFRSP
jgi:hypothetical protein